jgi:hypothetical protein
MERSDHGDDEDDEGKQSGDVGLEEHGTDDGRGCFVGGDVLGDGLVGEAQHNEEGDEEVLHLIFMICQIKLIHLNQIRLLPSLLSPPIFLSHPPPPLPAFPPLHDEKSCPCRLRPPISCI